MTVRQQTEIFLRSVNRTMVYINLREEYEYYCKAVNIPPLPDKKFIRMAAKIMVRQSTCCGPIFSIKGGK